MSKKRSSTTQPTVDINHDMFKSVTTISSTSTAPVDVVDLTEDEVIDLTRSKTASLTTVTGRNNRRISWFCTQHVDRMKKDGSGMLPSSSDIPAIIDKLNNFVDYLMVVKEFGEDGNTPHFHFYLKFPEPGVTKSRVVGLTTSTMDVQACKGTYEENLMYMEKTHAPILKFGTEPSLGQSGNYKRHKLQMLVDKFKAANYSLAAMDDVEILSHGKNLQLVAAVRSKQHKLQDLPGDNKSRNKILIGFPRVGKTMIALRHLRECPEGWHDHLLNKWTGVDVPPKAAWLFDDIGPEHHHLGQLLKRAGDRYPFTTEFKGGESWVRPAFVIVTSNYCLEELCRGDKNLIEALKERFDVVYVDKQMSDSVLTEAGFPTIPQEKFDEFEQGIQNWRTGSSSTFNTPNNTPFIPFRAPPVSTGARTTLVRQFSNTPPSPAVTVMPTAARMDIPEGCSPVTGVHALRIMRMQPFQETVPSSPTATLPLDDEEKEDEESDDEEKLDANHHVSFDI